MTAIPSVLVILMGLYGSPLAAAVTDDGANPTPQKVKMMVVSGDASACDDSSPKIVKWTSASGQGEVEVEGDVVFMQPDGSGQQKHVIKLRQMNAGGPADIQPGGPWLGVQFGPVPKALSAQLNLPAESGQMILNVAEGSPADLAGFQQYDIITAIDGQPASSNMTAFLEVVRSFNPNETHTFSLLRGGQQVQANVTVAQRPAPEAMPKMKYENEIEELSRGRVFGRGGMMEKDDQGNWVFKGFDAHNTPDFFKALPGVTGLDFDIALPGGSNQIFLHKTEGEEIRITREDDGQVTVTRTVTENGKESTTTTTYASVEEFKAQEPELSKKFKFLDKGAGFHFLGNIGDAGDWQQFSQLLDEQMQAKIQESLSKLHNLDVNMDLSGLDHLPRVGVFMGRPSTRFEVTPEGQIKVTTRSGEDELVEIFNNVQELETQRPDLYQRYQRFQERASRQ